MISMLETVVLRSAAPLAPTPVAAFIVRAFAVIFAVSAMRLSVMAPVVAVRLAFPVVLRIERAMSLFAAKVMSPVVALVAVASFIEMLPVVALTLIAPVVALIFPLCVILPVPTTTLTTPLPL